MPFIPIFGFEGVGAKRGSLITMREAPVVMSIAQTTPRVESEDRSVVGLSIRNPLRKTASLTCAAILMDGELDDEGKWMRYMNVEPGVGDGSSQVAFAPIT